MKVTRNGMPATVTASGVFSSVSPVLALSSCSNLAELHSAGLVSGLRGIPYGVWSEYLIQSSCFESRRLESSSG